MRVLLASLLLSCTSPPTFEDTARVLIPDELYIERGFGIYDGPQAYEREDLTVGLSWGLMPREVRIVNTPREWYETPRDEITLTIPEESQGYLMEILIGGSALLLTGGGAALYRKRKPNEVSTPDP